MKKFIEVITAAILSVGFIGSVASAESCSGNIVIHNSGDENNTTISCSDVKNVSLTCENNVTVANISYQDGKSGPAKVGGNESGGSASTGTVTNTNGTTTNIGVTGCGASATTSPSPTPSPSVTPYEPGKGAITPAAAAVSLPNTAANDSATIIAVSLAAAAGVVGLSRVAVSAYRRIGNK